MADQFINLTPLIGTRTEHPNNEKANVPELILSEAAKKYVMFRRMRMIAARDARDAPHQEFDDMGFVKWYDVQLKADNQYVAPRKNSVDTSINTGTIRDKDNTLVQYANKYEFEPVAQCFNEDDETMEELADTAEDMIEKSLELEQWKAKAKLIYRSMVTFGTALVEDAWVEHWIKDKQLRKGSYVGSEKAEWDEKVVKVYDGAQAKLFDLRKCYFGDIRKFFMNGPQGQPYFFTVEYESYDVTKERYGGFDRWKYVPTYVYMTPEVSANTTYSSYWTLRPISINYCEIIRYYDPIANEFAIMINGVDMLPIMEKKITDSDGAEKTLISGFPLTEISPSGAIPFAKYDLEPMHDFAYSKSQTAKMRVLGDIENMFFKLMLGMMKQKAKPTMGNKSGKNFDQSVTEPGQMINDIREGDLFPVLPNFQGAMPSDFSFYEMLKKELSKNSIQDSFQGINPTQADQTATQNLNDMKSGSLDVAALFDGIIFGNTQLYWLRTYNIIHNWTKPIDVKIDVLKKSIDNKYRTIHITKDGENGNTHIKKIIFTKDTPKRPKGKATLEDSMKVHQEEMDAKKNGEGDVSHVYLHPEQLRSIKYNWYYSCIPTLTESDPLSYMIFSKQLTDAINNFGIDSLNVKKLKKKFAKATGQDFDTWFLNQQELDKKQQDVQQQQMNNPQGQSPTIGNMAQGATPQVGTIMR